MQQQSGAVPTPPSFPLRPRGGDRDTALGMVTNAAGGRGAPRGAWLPVPDPSPRDVVVVLVPAKPPKAAEEEVGGQGKPGMKPRGGKTPMGMDEDGHHPTAGGGLGSCWGPSWPCCAPAGAGLRMPAAMRGDLGAAGAAGWVGGCPGRWGWPRGSSDRPRGPCGADSRTLAVRQLLTELRGIVPPKALQDKLWLCGLAGLCCSRWHRHKPLAQPGRGTLTPLPHAHKGLCPNNPNPQ